MKKLFEKFMNTPVYKINSWVGGFVLLAVAMVTMGATTSAIYLHHERSTLATLEADLQNREMGLDPTDKSAVGKFSDGTKFHLVSQEMPNVNLVGTLGVTGAVTLSNNLTLSLVPTGRVPYTTTAGLITNASTLAYDGTTLAVNNGTYSGTLGVTGLTNLGQLVLGAGSSTGQAIRITTTALSGASQYGLLSAPVSSSSATSDAVGIYTQAGTSAAAYTNAQTIGVQIDDAVKGAGSTITTQYGLKIETQTKGATNYAIRTGGGQNFIGDRVRISDGAVSVGTNVGVDVRMTTLASSSQYEINQSGAFNSAATAIGIGINASLSTAASAFTMANGAAIHIETPSIGASSAVTNLHGLWIDNQSGGGTNYAIRTGLGKVVFGDVVTADSLISSKFYTEGTFTGTLTGCTAGTTATISYVRVGKQVTVAIPSLLCTSNTTACTVTGLPAGLNPATQQQAAAAQIYDAGSPHPGGIVIQTSGVLTLQFYSAISTMTSTFTNSSSKGVGVASFSYTLQ